MCADACRLPFADGSFDGVISVESAFHFSSREEFFREAYRVLRPGGVVTMSDVATLRYPQGPRELLAAVGLVRAWGLRRAAAAAPAEIAGAAAAAGFADVRTELAGDRVIAPALRFVRDRLERPDVGATRSLALAARGMMAQADLVWERGLVDYLLLSARRPAERRSEGTGPLTGRRVASSARGGAPGAAAGRAPAADRGTP